MRELTETDIYTLADLSDIVVNEAELEEMLKRVNNGLAGLDKIDELPVNGQSSVGERTWSDPRDNEYNALSYTCNVGPSRRTSGILEQRTVGIKDNIMVAGVPMDGGSKTLKGFIPYTDAIVVERLRRAGASIIAKTNLAELARASEGSGTHKPIKNPNNSEYHAGASSGGSAAAVAGDIVDVALGTDTGGSIRIPASFCGIVGLKPTYGLVPLHGVVENTYTLDSVGPMANTVADCGRVLTAIAGKDGRDPGSLQAASHEDYQISDFGKSACDPMDFSSMNLGILTQGLESEVTEPVREQTIKTIEKAEEKGATIDEVSIESFEYEKCIKNIISFSEIADHWQDGAAAYRRGGIVDEAFQTTFSNRSSRNLYPSYKSVVLLGTELMNSYGGRLYTRALAARETVRNDYNKALDGLDALVLPSTPIVAPRAETGFNDREIDYAYNTRGVNLSKLPAISIPNGAIEGLPIGIQLISNTFQEHKLLRIAASFESIIELR